MTRFEPVTETRLIRSGLSMYRLLEQFCDVFDHVLGALAGTRLELLAGLLAVPEQSLSLHFDLGASLFETVLGGRVGLLVGLLTDLLGLLASLFDSLLTVLFGLVDDVVGVLFGLFNPVENFWPWHLLITWVLPECLFGSCEVNAVLSGAKNRDNVSGE
jgi:hypothetical protein